MLTEVSTGDRIGRRGKLLRAASRDDPAAVGSGAWAKVHNPVGGPDHGFVVLDHDQAVALMLKAAQTGDELIGVARMEAGGRLVEHIAYADEPRAKLRAQPGALELAARERVRPAAQRQIPEPELVEEFKPAADLAHQRPGHGLLSLVERQTVKEPPEVVDRQCRKFIDRLASQAHRPRFRTQPRAVAGGAGGWLILGPRRRDDTQALA